MYGTHTIFTTTNKLASYDVYAYNVNVAIRKHFVVPMLKIGFICWEIFHNYNNL